MSDEPTAGPSTNSPEPDPSVTTSGETTGAECPYCGSENTEREHPRGPSRCQSIHYCNDCLQQFKKFE
ncbi:1,2-phenylacetyl-CoA epoxidase subunit PaaE [Halolamina sediminis]|jgi:transposase-like protein|uniref:1,2-phenylacetyl-CoA epoxidase subunit PaaE n=1 Tax=Halolamina sediminis TaxID=1480675 RepID=UPI0006B4B273|nr:1,2-phenylacetyl-CoA epoxidase subunit PaaE [Halolamina sediminis]